MRSPFHHQLVPTALLVAAFAVLACRSAPRETASIDATRADSGTASNYSADSTGRAGARPVPGTHAGTQLEAPRIIPSVQVGMRQLQTAPTEGNRTAHKNQLGDLVNAMGADLSRVGLADSGSFKALSDSVLGDMSGGTGRADGPPAKEIRAHVDRVNRLITNYDALMSGAKRSR